MSNLRLLGRLRDGLTEAAANAIFAMTSMLESIAANESNINAVADNIPALQNSSQILNGFFSSRNSLIKTVSIVSDTDLNSTPVDPLKPYEIALVDAKNVVLRGVNDPNEVFLLGDVSQTIHRETDSTSSSLNSLGRSIAYVYVGVDSLGVVQIKTTRQDPNLIGLAFDPQLLFDGGDITHYDYLGLFSTEYGTIFLNDILYTTDVLSGTETANLFGSEFTGSFTYSVPNFSFGHVFGRLELNKTSGGDGTGNIEISVNRNERINKSKKLQENIALKIGLSSRATAGIFNYIIDGSFGSGALEFSFFVDKIVFPAFSHPGITVSQSPTIENASLPIFKDSSLGDGTNGYGELVGEVDGVNKVFFVSNGSYSAGSVYADVDSLSYTHLHGMTEADPANGRIEFNIAPENYARVEYR